MGELQKKMSQRSHRHRCQAPCTSIYSLATSSSVHVYAQVNATHEQSTRTELFERCLSVCCSGRECSELNTHHARRPSPACATHLSYWQHGKTIHFSVRWPPAFLVCFDVPRLHPGASLSSPSRFVHLDDLMMRASFVGRARRRKSADRRSGINLR